MVLALTCKFFKERRTWIHHYISTR